jgi:hypothetical protein
MARKRTLRLYNGLFTIETLCVVFGAVKSCVIELIYRVERMWLREEKRYSDVVERSVEGEEWEARRRTVRSFRVG